MTPVSITIERRVQWMDTDAAGIWHHTTLVRWIEEAEAELHREQGIIGQTFGATPRVHAEYDYHLPLRFDEPISLTLTVEALGETSITYGVDLQKDGTRVASGRLIAVFIDRKSGEKRPWTEEIRAALQPR